jgi:hypothetical protein
MVITCGYLPHCPALPPHSDCADRVGFVGGVAHGDDVEHRRVDECYDGASGGASERCAGTQARRHRDRQAGRQAQRQAGRQAGRRTATGLDTPCDLSLCVRVCVCVCVCVCVRVRARARVCVRERERERERESEREFACVVHVCDTIRTLHGKASYTSYTWVVRGSGGRERSVL